MDMQPQTTLNKRCSVQAGCQSDWFVNYDLDDMDIAMTTNDATHGNSDHADINRHGNEENDITNTTIGTLIYVYLLSQAWPFSKNNGRNDNITTLTITTSLLNRIQSCHRPLGLRQCGWRISHLHPQGKKTQNIGIKGKTWWMCFLQAQDSRIFGFHNRFSRTSISPWESWNGNMEKDVSCTQPKITPLCSPNYRTWEYICTYKRFRLARSTTHRYLH